MRGGICEECPYRENLRARATTLTSSPFRSSAFLDGWSVGAHVVHRTKATTADSRGGTDQELLAGNFRDLAGLDVRFAIPAQLIGEVGRFVANFLRFRVHWLSFPGSTKLISYIQRSAHSNRSRALPITSSSPGLRAIPLLVPRGTGITAPSLITVVP